MPTVAVLTAVLTLAAAGPAHVQSFTFYGLNDVNAAIPAGWMAQHVDVVEDDGFTAQHAEAFKRAGGKIALAYTDPTLVPYCAPPFRPPAGACEGPIGNVVATDESAWFHDARGERVRRRYEDPHFKYQEILNPGSSAARHAYARTTAGILGHAPHLDGFIADDSGSSFTGRDGVIGSNLFGSFENRGVEIRDDAQWIEADGLREVTAHHKLALCLPTGPPQPARRLYVYASWLLTYDPRYSVFGMQRTLSDGYAVFPETTLVPGAPLASGPIAALRRGALYAREFAGCRIADTEVGPCAAVVHPGGRVRIAAGAPSSLAPETAAILVR